MTPQPHTESLYADLTRRLARVDLLLLRAVRRQRSRPAMHAKGQFWGQYLTDDEIDNLLMSSGEIDAPVGQLLDGLDARVAATVVHRDRPDAESKLLQLRDAFDLDGDDLDLLLLCAAPEVAAGYGRIFAYLQDNLNQPFLTVDLAGRILRPTRRQRLALQRRLLPDGHLIRKKLLELDERTARSTQATRRVSLPARLLHWLLTPGALPFLEGSTRMPISADPFVPQACDEATTALGAVWARHGEQPAGTPRPIAVLTGGTEGLREGVAMYLAREAGKKSIVRVRMERAESYANDPSELVRDLRIGQDVLLLDALPENNDDPEVRKKLLRLANTLASIETPLCIGARDRRTAARILSGERPEVHIRLGRTTATERAQAWRKALDRRGMDPEQQRDVDTLAVRFSAIGGTTIDRVLDRAEAYTGETLTDELLLQSCRDSTRPDLTSLAQPISPRYSWDDLILAPAIKNQLQQLEAYLREQETVMYDWNLQRIRPRGYGLKALFSGAPGTGKTMCAEVIAHALGYDLYKVDLSSVVSKWVGETEKNLREVFDAAEGGTSVLLFDEGDALFGSRGDTNNAQDKYANQEVSYLLQRLEAFEGCVIITTNLQENIDEAFLRRFGAVVEFPFPTAAERARLWERALPDEAFRADEIDVARLGKAFHLSGGSIVNAAINAAIGASAEKSLLTMRHCVVAVARELHKMGKQVSRVHFGDFYEEVEGLFL